MGIKMCSKIVEAVEKEKIIVIVRGVGRERLIPLAEAMYEGGIRLLEITYSSDPKADDNETAENIKMLKDHFNGRMFIGAGTVLTKEQVLLTKNAGGEFIISPGTDPDVIKYTKELDMVSIPGALTPSEIAEAHNVGADFVKVFPAVNLGPSYIKAVLAPLSTVKLLAVGGIDENNMQDYLRAGVLGFGVGGNICKRNLIESGDYSEIANLARKYVAAVK